MAEKGFCPGCNSTTSSVLAGWANDGRCPFCQLPAEVASQVQQARDRNLADDLISRYLAAEQRADKAEREAARLKRILDSVRAQLEAAEGAS